MSQSPGIAGKRLGAGGQAEGACLQLISRCRPRIALACLFFFSLISLFSYKKKCLTLLSGGKVREKKNNFFLARFFFLWGMRALGLQSCVFLGVLPFNRG